MKILHDLGIAISTTSIQRKKKQLVAQQEKRIQKVVTDYVKHVETKSDVEMQIAYELSYWEPEPILLYIKSYQDKNNKKKPLSWETTLNIRADELASQYLQAHHHPMSSHFLHPKCN